MRAPTGWLAEYCDPGLGAAELAERLTMTGTEVERLALHGAPSDEGFVVGRVLAVEPHPDADRLRVCEVDVGEDGPRTIVCGAPNVAAEQLVAVALPGAVMPGGQKLGKARLRGVESSGMILSETEMEAGEDGGGIAVLGDASGTSSASRPGAPGAELIPGAALGTVLPISEPVLELEITPNRPDCLSIYGVAREVHAISGAALAPAPWEDDAEATGGGEASDYASVTVEVPELCPRFSARVFTDVEIGPSPLWLKQRLLAAGQRPINNVVDITNYVMLLSGQPLHAFDLDKVPGGELIIRRAADGEKMRTLDDVERTFDSEAVLVCDRNGPSGIAGIMGGQVSEVSAETRRVLLEAATWNGPNILATSGKLGLRSEASTRFEKQIHPDLAIRAQRLASRLFVELCGARLVPGTIDVDAGAYEPRELTLRIDRMEGLLGMRVGAEQAAEYLRRLGFGVEDAGEGQLAVSVPADRHFDVTREVDLIEEVARVHGIDAHLPATLPERAAGLGALAPHQRALRRAEDILRDAGLDQAITWTFADPGRAARLLGDGVGAAPIVIHNPLSEEQSVMRTELLGGLLGAAAHNLARGSGRAALFESGRVYLPESPPAEGGVLDGRFGGRRPAPAAEPHRIAALIAGPLAPPSWRGGSEDADFYVAKGLIELLAAGLLCEVGFEPVGEDESDELPFLHPGRGARLLVGGRPAGWLGELHPALAAEWELPACAAFELDAGPLIAASGRGAEHFEDVTTFPALYEDLAVTIGPAITAAAVEEAIRQGGGELLADTEIFDLYEGEQVGEGNRSLAVRLEFRSPERTLTDAEVAERRAAIVAGLERIGASLRG